ncbi:hypothetical protein AVEN_70824-1, partial [Araneus ventricosus]
MDVIASTAFSLQLDSYNDPKNKFVECANNAFSPSFNIKNTFHLAAIVKALTVQQRILRLPLLDDFTSERGVR